ncbi:hypothetical protein, partial [Dickeya solani]|uniref:hypothetical protein n=1 Tax=Dickeya solani TaxID=1089444 RepID=UPI001E526028
SPMILTFFTPGTDNAGKMYQCYLQCEDFRLMTMHSVTTGRMHRKPGGFPVKKPLVAAARVTRFHRVTQRWRLQLLSGNPTVPA